jgi:hypothetical protein
MEHFERAIALFKAEHEIVNIVYEHIDRIRGQDNDPLEKCAKEFIDAVIPAINSHLQTIRKLSKRPASDDNNTLED